MKKQRKTIRESNIKRLALGSVMCLTTIVFFLTPTITNATVLVETNGDASSVEAVTETEATPDTNSETTEETSEPTGSKVYFIISAYYSPVPGQNKYVTGSYQGDIRLNGGGVHGADGTPVYPGMVAAPSSYAFGTKMYIPGIGVVAVHDRGGAIVQSGQRGNSYDRLDIWMGYGDVGLKRALSWGKRTVEVTLYGIDNSIKENVTLEGFTADEKKQAELARATLTPISNPVAAPVIELLFDRELNYGSTGDDVGELQELLKKLGYYKGTINSVYDDNTMDAVTKFQIDQKIVAHESAFGSGYVGQRTIQVLSSLAGKKNIAHAKTESITKIEYFATDLKKGDTSEDVRKLQEELKKIHLLGIEPTGFYGDVTEHAVFKFQQTYKLAGDEKSVGAGIFGPVTRGKFNEIVAARLRTEQLLAEKSLLSAKEVAASQNQDS